MSGLRYARTVFWRSMSALPRVGVGRRTCCRSGGVEKGCGRTDPSAVMRLVAICHGKTTGGSSLARKRSEGNIFCCTFGRLLSAMVSSESPDETNVASGSCHGIGAVDSRVNFSGSQDEVIRMGGYISGGQRSKSRCRVCRPDGVAVLVDTAVESISMSSSLAFFDETARSSCQ